METSFFLQSKLVLSNHGSTTLKIAYRAQNLIDAQLIKDQLASAFIDSQVQGEYLQGGVGELPAMGLVHILVHDEDLERARNIVIDWEHQHLGTSNQPAVAASRDYLPIFLIVAVITSAVLLMLAP